MKVGFGDRGADGSHQSNAVRKSTRPADQAINTVADRMRRSSSEHGPLNRHDGTRGNGSKLCRASILPDPPTRQGKEAGPASRKGAVPPDPPAMSMHKTTDKKLEGVKCRFRQEVKSRRVRSDKVIVDFPKEGRINSTVHAKERGAAIGNPINEILSLSCMSLDRKTHTDATSYPEKHEQRQSMQYPHSSMTKHHNGKRTHQFEESLDWSQTSIHWGDEEVLWGDEED